MLRVVWLEMGGPFRPWWEEALPVFDRAGVQLTAATLFDAPPFHDEMRQHGVQTINLACTGSRDYARAVWALAHRARSRQVDVVHGVESIPAAITSLSGLAAQRNVLRVFHRQHLVPKAPAKYFATLAQRSSHLVLMPSQSVADRALSLEHVSPRKVRLVYNGAPSPRNVESPELAGLRAALGIPTGAKVVSMVTRLRVEKGVQFFLPAVAEASLRLDCPIYAVIVGTGPYEAQLHSQADQLQLNVRWTGYQSDVIPWFYLSDIVCIPSLFDALPYSAAEAMGCGRAVVASDVGGIPELIEHDQSGLLVPPGDVSALCGAIVRLLREDTLRTRLGNNARARFHAGFTAAANAEAIVRAWRDTT